MKPRIYNKSMTLIGVLQNASEIGYTHKYNDLYVAKFKLPANDPKNDLCETYNIVDIFDGEESKGKYRILEEPDSDITSEGSFIEYSLEHVITFLMNDVIDGYLELGGYNVRTADVIRNILSRQTVQRWQLGECDFDRQFQYSWENTSIMDALYSIPTCFDEDYHWVYDTTTYPWTISLKRTSTDRSCEIRRKRNMKFIKRHVDGSKLCTRLYCKGYGEGVNQLTVAEVNNGLPYIQDDAAVAKYGVLASHWIDRRFTNPETLYARGLAILNELKNPVVTYTASAVDLSRVTGYDWDKFDEGKSVHMIDDERSVDVDALIIEVGKDDVDGKPLDMTITICNKSSDVSSDLEDIARRASINSQYSQGATNLYCQQFADNADGTHPAKMNIFIPASCSKINQILLSWNCTNFRAYSKSAKAGGATTGTTTDGGSTTVTSEGGGGSTYTSSSGGGSTYTSSSGGGDTYTSSSGGGSTYTSSSGAGDTYTSTDGGSSTYTSSSGGGDTYTSTGGGSSTYTSASGGGSTVTSTSGGGQTASSNNGGSTTVTSTGDGGISLSLQMTSEEQVGFTPANTHCHFFSIDVAKHTHTVSIGNHSHTVTITGHSHDVTIAAHTHTVTISDHTHKVTIPNHSHSVTTSDHSHKVTIPNHSHTVTIPNHSHSVTIPNHSHSVETRDHNHSVTIREHTHGISIPAHKHSVTILDHSHNIDYGIYEGGRASSCTLKVDGTVAQTDVQNGNDIDIIPYLSKDNEGKIIRGTWHTIEIVPNDLTRIEANLFVKTFVTSYTGGNY